MKTLRPIGYHLICGLADSRVIAPTVEQRRVVARTIAEQSEAVGVPLLAFNVPDTHLHLEIAAALQKCNEVARLIEITVGARLKLGVGFKRVSSEPILRQGHLQSTFEYILRQQARHKLAWDPYHEASNLHDLVGLRLVASHTARFVRELLPRVDRRLLLEFLGVDELKEASWPVAQVVPAACAAIGRADLSGRDEQVRAAWRAVLEVLRDRMPWASIARLLGVSRQTLYNMSRIDPQPRLVRALHLQIGLRQALRERPSGAFLEPSPATSRAG